MHLVERCLLWTWQLHSGMRGLDRQLRVWLTGNVAGPVLLYLCHTDLTRHLSGAFHSSKLMSLDHAYAALLVVSLGVLTWMYHTLYNSDPGSPDAISNSAAQSAPCEHCGMTSPTIRVRHDFATGKCVVAFDHYCMLINTTVGDSNHALFLAYCTLQWFLIMWGWMLAWHAVRPCYSLFDLTAAAQCWHYSALRALVLLWAGMCLTIAAIVFTILVVFHSYLAATNQTTYEMMKHSSVQYLQPYYDAMGGWDPPPDIEEERKAGRKSKARLPFVWVMIYRHLSGKEYHPRPFDHGLVQNLNWFLFAKKPYVHRVAFRPAEADTRRNDSTQTV